MNNAIPDKSHPAPAFGPVVCLLLVVYILGFQPIMMCDPWWHLATGRLIAETGRIPSSDPFSFTVGGREWTPHSWLPDLLFFELYKTGGFPALSFLIPMAGVLMIFPLYLLLVKLAGSDRTAAFVSLLFFFPPSRIAWFYRPNLISLFFSIVFFYFIETRLFSVSRSAAILMVLAFCAFWANFHGGFVVSLVILAAFFLAPPHGPADAPTSEGFLTGRRRLVALCMLAAACAGLMTPNGTRLWAYVLTVKGVSSEFIREWHSPDFHLFWPFAWYIGLTVLILVRADEKPGTRHLLFYVFWLCQFLFSVRHLPFLCLATALVLARPIASLLGRNRPMGAFAAISAGDNHRSLAVTCAFLLLLSGLCATGFLQLPFQVKKHEPAHRYPTKTLEVIKKLPEDCRVFNEYPFGGYLIWFAPGRKVFIDGRAVLYGKKFLDMHKRVMKASPGWEKDLDSYGVTHMLLRKGSVLANLLEKLSYRKLAEDEVSVLFARPRRRT